MLGWDFGFGDYEVQESSLRLKERRVSAQFFAGEGAFQNGMKRFYMAPGELLLFGCCTSPRTAQALSLSLSPGSNLTPITHPNRADYPDLTSPDLT